MSDAVVLPSSGGSLALISASTWFQTRGSFSISMCGPGGSLFADGFYGRHRCGDGGHGFSGLLKGHSQAGQCAEERENEDWELGCH